MLTTAKLDEIALNFWNEDVQNVLTFFAPRTLGRGFKILNTPARLYLN